MEALRSMNLPPGFGFYPSDTELVGHYLKRKILGQKIEHDLIPEVDIYKHEPWDLPAKCNFPIEDNKWHFFASRDRKYPTGSRSNRATVAGYWKSTGKDRSIKLNKRTLGTKKTLVFHEGRPPSGRRTEWIMHEYYIDEKECQVSPDMKDAFVLCRVTKRNDWALENDNEVDNRNPHPQQLNDAATSVVSAVKPEDAATSVVSAVKPEDAAASVICAEEPNHVATPVGSAELSNDVSIAAIAADTASPNGSNELEAWLEELLDPSPSFNPVADAGSANPSSVVPKIGPDHASPIKDGTDATDYLFTDDLPDDLYSMLYPGNDDFSNSIFMESAGQAEAFATNQTYCLMEGSTFALPNNSEDGTPKDELQLDQENNNPNLSNGNIDSGIIRRTRATASTANISPAGYRIKMQVGIKKMVASNTESINQTMRFADNSGRRLDLITNAEHQKEHANNATSVKQSGAAKPSEAHSNQGDLRGTINAFRFSSAGFNIYMLFAIFVVGIAVSVALHYNHLGASL
ncbi:NAC domain-containing protein 74 [Dichanthelium oligosanthes]|uniref:NAC domain-containing protein 74 n=1 Tax=Dichanthelium oligosanthes TaxID=888268 RepID=A0A1E5W8C0_9POAL|nr:NAC domain-containing protein 74 [Dichanthelium oligosanthes]